MEKNKIIQTIKLIIGLLHSNDYERIVDLDIRKPLTADEIKQAIEEYGGDVTFPPEVNFDDVDIYPLKGYENQVHADFDLWINNEKSDLTLSLVILKIEDLYRYSIKGIRVL